MFRALFGQRDAVGLADRVRRKSVLDTVSKQITTFRSRLGTEDQAKVQLHFDAVRELERRLDTPAAACKVEPLTGAPPARDAGALPALIRAQMDNIVTAFRCDVTRVATLALGARGAGLGNIRSTWPGISPLVFPNGENERDHHIDITHNHNNGPEKLMTENWVMQQVAYLIGKLKATPEPGGAGRTMLDNTVVLYMNSMGNGGAHSAKPLPCFIAGSCGGYFKTGRYVRVGGWAKEPIDTSGPGVPHNRLLVALANAMLVGVTTDTPLSFFGEAKYGGELTELRG